MATYALTSSVALSGALNLVDPTMFNASEAATTALTTSYLISSGYTTGAIVVTHIGFKISVRSGTTGTLTGMLRNITDSVDVTGTNVTINTADLPVCTTAGLDGGWQWLKLASPITLTAGKSYGLQLKTSSGSQVSVFATSANNWSVALITSATGTPVAGDNIIYNGEYTGAGTSNSFTLTWDNTTSGTDWGSAPTSANSLLTPGIAGCNKGTLALASTAATNFYMKMSNSIIQYAGSTWDETTLASDSTFDLNFDMATNVDYGFLGRGLFTNNRSGKDYTYDKCFLNTDEAANSTSLGVDTNTAWPDNAVIAIASTTRTSTQCESGTLNGAAGASTLTVDGFGGAGGGLLYAHGGTSPVQAEIILLTRSTTWRGTSSSLQGYVNFSATGSVNWDWCALRHMGSNTTGKRGFETACTTGTQTYDYISHYDFVVASSRGFSHTATSGTGLAINNYVSYNVAQEHFINVASSGTAVMNNFCGLLNTQSNTRIFEFGDVGGTITNITAAGGVQITIYFNEANFFGTISNITCHSCANDNIQITGGYGTISGIKTYRSNTNGIQFPTVTNSLYKVRIDNLEAFGNTTNNVRVGGGGDITLNNAVISGDSTFATTNGISNQGNAGYLVLTMNSCTLGVASGIKTAHTNDFSLAGLGYVQVDMNNCITASPTEIATQTSLPPNGMITSQRHDQTKGLHKVFKRQGTITIETTIVPSGETTSAEMNPLSSTDKLLSLGRNGGFKVRVADGQTCTPTIEVYEDASYNGNRAELWVKRNDAMGITSDTLLATATSASDGAFEALSGTTIAVTDNGTLDFYIACNGTAGGLMYGKPRAIVT